MITEAVTWLAHLLAGVFVAYLSVRDFYRHPTDRIWGKLSLLVFFWPIMAIAAQVIIMFLKLPIINLFWGIEGLNNTPPFPPRMIWVAIFYFVVSYGGVVAVVVRRLNERLKEQEWKSDDE